MVLLELGLITRHEVPIERIKRAGITLTPEEMDDWRDITQKIRQNFFRQQDGKPDEFLSKLYRDRRAILETAQNKLVILKALLKNEDMHDLKHMTCPP